MQIAFWSNLHGQGATTANAAAFACVISQKTSYRVLIAQNHSGLNALERYLMRKREQAAARMLDYTNSGMDALVRLYKNGRLRPEKIPDYTWSLMKNHGLDLLFGSEKSETLREESQELILNIFKCAREAYDLVILDLHSGLEGTNTKALLETSDIVVYCISQNRALLDSLRRITGENPLLAEKRSAYIISRYEPSSSLTMRNLAREYGLEINSVFAIPYHAGFMDACNSGRVFEFMACCLQAKKGEDREFARSLLDLADHVMKGCGK